MIPLTPTPEVMDIGQRLTFALIATRADEELVRVSIQGAIDEVTALSDGDPQTTYMNLVGMLSTALASFTIFAQTNRVAFDTLVGEGKFDQALANTAAEAARVRGEQ